MGSTLGTVVVLGGSMSGMLAAAAALGFFEQGRALDGHPQLPGHRIQHRALFGAEGLGRTAVQFNLAHHLPTQT